MEISIKDLEVNIGNKKILKGITMDLLKNKSIGIIGPNGSGKSTLLKTIYRVLKPSAGAIYIDKKALNEYKVSETAKKMAVVAQHNEQNFDFSVFDMVLMGRSPHKNFFEGDTSEDIKIAKDSISKVGMEGFESRSYNSLSGGEKQRVILARALAQNTECIILDEPTNHLDIRYQIQFMEIANSLGITVVSAMHDLNLALTYCEYIFAIKDGKLYDYGKPQNIITEKLIEDLYKVKSNIINTNGTFYIKYIGLC